jgi:hypothetical protein
MALSGAAAVLEEIQRAGENGAACHAQMYIKQGAHRRPMRADPPAPAGVGGIAAGHAGGCGGICCAEAKSAKMQDTRAVPRMKSKRSDGFMANTPVVVVTCPRIVSARLVPTAKPRILQHFSRALRL